MDLGIAGKVAFVAGGSKGLGRAVAEALAAEGADVIICARGEDALVEARESIRDGAGVRVVAVTADLAEPGAAAEAVAKGASQLATPDILVTNAGGPPPGPFETHDDAAWNRAIRLNLMSAIDLTRAALPSMKAKRWGRIINITSIAVKQPVDDLILSNSVRAAVTGFARTLANEVATHGITVNNVMPGYTRTARLEQLADIVARRRDVPPDSKLEVWNDQIPMRRLGEPEEFAAVVAFLASRKASYITGTSIPVDGGWIRSLL